MHTVADAAARADLESTQSRLIEAVTEWCGRYEPGAHLPRFGFELTAFVEALQVTAGALKLNEHLVRGDLESVMYGSINLHVEAGRVVTKVLGVADYWPRLKLWIDRDARKVEGDADVISQGLVYWCTLAPRDELPSIPHEITKWFVDPLDRVDVSRALSALQVRTRDRRTRVFKEVLCEFNSAIDKSTAKWAIWAGLERSNWTALKAAMSAPPIPEPLGSQTHRELLETLAERLLGTNT